jgi:integrase
MDSEILAGTADYTVPGGPGDAIETLTHLAPVPSFCWCRRARLTAEGRGSAHFGPGPTAPIDTREETADNSLVVFEGEQNIVENRRGRRSASTTVNSSVRTREYLTTAEIERLMAAARNSSRYGHRDATMILIGYRHGLRASELCDLQWSQVELATGRLHVRRAKNGSPSVHPRCRVTRYAPCDVCGANGGRPRTSL